MDKKRNRKSETESEKKTIICGFGERIKIAAKNVNGASELSRLTEIPRNTLQRYITEETEPPIGTIEKISRATNVSLEWLIVGDRRSISGFSEEKSQSSDDFKYNPRFSGASKSQNKPVEVAVDRIERDLVKEATVALYGYLEKKKRYLKPEEFGEAVLFLCDLAPDHGEIDISLVERLMKFKG